MVEQFMKVSDVKYALYILERACQQLDVHPFEHREHRTLTKNLLLEKMFIVCHESSDREQREQSAPIMFKCCLELEPGTALRAKYTKQFIDFVISQ